MDRPARRSSSASARSPKFRRWTAPRPGHSGPLRRREPTSLFDPTRPLTCESSDPGTGHSAAVGVAASRPLSPFSDRMSILQKLPFENEHLTFNAPMDTRRKYVRHTVCRSHPAGPDHSVRRPPQLIPTALAAPLTCNLFGRDAILPFICPRDPAAEFLGAFRICFGICGHRSSDGGAFGCGPPGPPRATRADWRNLRRHC